MFGIQKGQKGIGMEGAIANWYAKNTAGDREEFVKHARSVVQQVPENGRILEVAPGPGYLAVEMERLGNYRITGLDISRSAWPASAPRGPASMSISATAMRPPCPFRTRPSTSSSAGPRSRTSASR